MGTENGFSVENQKDSSIRKVVIIGAGIAGLTAAAQLHKSGINVIVLEGSNRIGGRISSVELATVPGQKVELGANWIHGIDANPIYRVCRQNNLLEAKYEGRRLGTKVMFLTNEGEPVNTKLVSEVDMAFGMLMSECDEFYQDQRLTPMENDSVGAFAEREFCEKFARYHGKDFEDRKRLMEHRMLWESIITGCPTLYDLSLSEVGSFEELAGIHFTIPNGFESVTKLLASQLPSESILLDHYVNSIVTNENDGTAVVTCSNGKQFHADHVLVTVSLGILQKYAATLFRPPLPEAKQEALNHLVIGTVNKIVLEFDDQVLPDEVMRLELIWDRTSLPEEDITQSWMKKICMFETVEKNVLMGWICGREAEYIETLSDEQVGETCVNILRMFMANTGRRLPNLQRVFISRWKSNEMTLGSYTYIPVGAEVRHVEALAEPVYCQTKPVLLFAGEATHPQYYSSSHGALLSGQREAERLISFYSQ